MLRAIGLALLSTATLAFFPAAAAAQANPFGSCKVQTDIRSIASNTEDIPERADAKRITLTGSEGAPVVAICDDTTLQAQTIVWENDTHMIYATGDVLFQQKDLRIAAQRAVVNGQTKLGTFYQFTGSATLGRQPAQKSTFGTNEADVLFNGEEISKVGPKTYKLKNAHFTTCLQPTPRWEMTLSDGSMTLDEHALLRNVVLKVKDVPLLYLPAIYYPINKEGRSTGFLMPAYGSSTVFGTSLTNAFFWAISRSQDATFYHEWFSKTGQGYKGEYRYVEAPGSQGQVSVHVLDQKAQLATDGSGAIASPAHRSYTLDGSVNQALPHGFRLVGQTNFFTDAATQQFYQDVNDFSRNTRSFNGSITGAIHRLRVAGTMQRSDYFFGVQSASRIGQLPSINVSFAETPIGRTRIYYGLGTQTDHLVKQDNTADPTTNHSLWRTDVKPTIRAPLSSLPYLAVTASADWEITHWTQTLDPVTQTNVPVALTRQLFHFRTEVVGPTFARVFRTPTNGYADRFKHTIEPEISFDRTTPFQGFNSVVKNDYSIDSLVGGVTQIGYGITSHLLAHRVAGPPPAPAAAGSAPASTPGGTPAGTPGTSTPAPAPAPAAPAAAGVRDILTVSVTQTYYSDALAANYDPQYQSATGTSTVDPRPNPYSPVSIRATARPVDYATAQFQMDIDSRYRKIRTMNAGGSLDGRRLQVTASWQMRLTIPGLPGFDDPTLATQFLNASTTVKTRDNRLGGTYGFNYDVKNRAFLQQRIVAYYNSQCCGIAFDWQSISTPLLNVPSDRRFGVSFTLAGIGSFSNPFGSFGAR